MRRIAGLVFVGAALATLPFVIGVYPIHVVNLVLVSIISAVGLNLVTGLAGQISLCHASFSGITAYVLTLGARDLGLPFWLGWPLGALVAAGVGYLVGVPALRLQGHYLALATLGLGEIFLLTNVHLEKVTNGPNGLDVPAPQLLGFAFRSETSKYYLVLVATALLVAIAWNLHRSKLGRVLTSVMDSEIASQAFGVNLAQYKTLAFAISAFYAGAAGGLYAIVVGFITPYEFGLWPSLWTLTMVVIGGMGQLWGAALGAVVITALPEVLRALKDYQELIYGLLLLATLMYMPGGLYGLVTAARDAFRTPGSRARRG